MADAPVSLASLYTVASLLDREHIPYAFIGGAALNTWGIPRSTFDLDIAIAAEEPKVARLLDACTASGFVVDPVFRGGFRDRVSGMETLHVHVPAGRSLLAIDFFLTTTPFLRSVIERRGTIDLGQGPVFVCSSADLVLLELIADRPKDRVDVQNVLAVQGVPEREYLLRWAGTLGVSERLERALNPSTR